jgi:hypothetical protein
MPLSQSSAATNRKHSVPARTAADSWSANEHPIHQGVLVIDQTRQQAKMNDGAVSRRPQIHDLTHRGGIFIASHDKRSRADAGRVTGLVNDCDHAGTASAKKDQLIGASCLVLIGLVFSGSAAWL